MERLVTEGEVLDDAVSVGFVNDRSFAEPAATFRVFAGEQMASAGVGTQHFAGGGDLEPLGHRFLCFDAFGATHKVNFLLKRAGNIGTGLHRSKRYFEPCRTTKALCCASLTKSARRRPCVFGRFRQATA